jgi:hypothetical protein
MLHKIVVGNKALKCSWNLLHLSEENKIIFYHLLWIFALTIEAFRCYRPKLSIDGIFLSWMYKGTLLMAILSDANNQLLLLTMQWSRAITKMVGCGFWAA